MATQPISGNQFFTQVVYQASQLPSLDVAELQSGATAVNSLAVTSSSAATDLDSNGHVIKSQKTAPTLALTSGWNSSDEISFVGPATDTSGIIRVTQTGFTSGNQVTTLTFNKPFPSGSIVQVMITPASEAVSNPGAGFFPQIYCTGTETGFTVNTRRDGSAVSVPTILDFAYSVVATTSM